MKAIRILICVLIILSVLPRVVRAETDGGAGGSAGISACMKEKACLRAYL